MDAPTMRPLFPPHSTDLSRRWRSRLTASGLAMGMTLAGIAAGPAGAAPSPSRGRAIARQSNAYGRVQQTYQTRRTKFISDVPGGSLSSGERRGACPSGVWNSDNPLQIAVPSQVIGKTANERPTFLVKVDAKPAAPDEQLFISFAIAVIAPNTPDDSGPDEGVLNLSYTLEDQDIPALGEWFTWQLPETAPVFQPSDHYRLFVTATCIAKASADDRSDSHIAIADIKKLPSDTLTTVRQELAQVGPLAETNWSDRLTILERNGLWFEYFAELRSAALASYPEAYGLWAQAMQDVGLKVSPLPGPDSASAEEAVPATP